MVLHVNSTIGGAKGNNNQLYLKRADDGEFPVLDWEVPFVPETADAFKMNGSAATLIKMRSTGDGMFFEFAAVEAGTVITISGTYVSEQKATKYVFEESQFVWTGEKWERNAVYTKYDIGALQFQTMQPNANNMAYFKRADGEAIPIKTTENDLNWTTAFSYAAGSVKLNGENVTPTVKFPEGMFIEFGAVPNVGDILTIGGTFYSADLEVQYAIAESVFQWNGTAWESYVAKPEINYTEYKVTSIAAANGSTVSALYLYPTAGVDAFPNGNEDWNSVYTFAVGSGKGMSLDGAVLTTTDIKLPGSDLYIGLGANASEGSIFIIDGEYYNEEKGIKLIFENCALQWNGSAWVAYTPEEGYTQYKVKAISATDASTASVLYLYPAAGIEAFPNGNEDWSSVYTFEVGSGKGMSLGGEAITTTDIKLPGTDFFIAMGVEAKEGDIFTIDGTYFNAEKGIKLVFEDCALQYNGTSWVTYAEFKTYELGMMALHVNSTIGGAKGDNSVLYLKRADDGVFPVLSWDIPFVPESADCFKVNGEAANLGKMRSTADGMYFLFEAVEAGTVITIGGTYVSEQSFTKYVIEESNFVWTGTAWEKYVEYVTFEIGALSFANFEGGNKNMPNFYRVDGEAIPIKTTENDLNWTTAFSYAPGSVKLNGNDITPTVKFPHDLFVEMTIPNEGDVLVIGGAFYSPDLGIKYIVTESTFIFNGTVWVSQLEVAKAEAIQTIDTYKATFVQEDYYETEWNSFNAIIAEATAKINAAMTVADVEAAVAAAKTAMDDVVTKAESDAKIEEIKTSAKAELAAYKAESDYTVDGWAAIQAIIAKAGANIDAAISVTEVEAVVVSAKAEMDAVKTAAQVAEEQAFIDAAVAELTAYKTESDYDAEGWAAIQAIINKAGADMSAVIGDEAAINAIVATAKADMDKVLNAVDSAAAALAAAKTAAKAEVQAYYGALNFNQYSDEAMAMLSGYVAGAMTAIEAATTAEEAADAVLAFKTSVDNVEKMQPSGGNSGANDGATSTGCGSVVDGGLAAGVLVAAAAVMALRKKKED